MFLPEFSLIDFVEDLENPELPDKVIEEASQLLLGISLAQSTLDDLGSVLSPVPGEWTIAWYEYQDDQGDMIKKEVVESRLVSCFQSMLQLGEFQLM